MPLTNSLRDDILAAVPSLRAFAISLSGNADRADDLVQETLLRALANIDSFQPGSNLPAWLPVRARAYRRNNGKCSATSCERDIPTPFISGQTVRHQELRGEARVPHRG